MNLDYERDENNFQVTPISFLVSVICAVYPSKDPPSNLQQSYCSLATSSP